MVDTLKANELFLARSANVLRYKRSFLRQAVCELRYPTLLQFGDRTPPAALVNLLRKEYPYVEQSTEFSVHSRGGATEPVFSHVFKSSKANWVVTFRTNLMTIETSNYVEYDQLRERILKVVEQVKHIIDTEFFTRVGLRYINVVPCSAEPIPQVHTWINNILIGPLVGGVARGVREYAGRIVLSGEDGGALLQHGIQIRPDSNKPDYLIDVDSFRNEISLGELGPTLDDAHRQGFDIFDWALTEKSRQFLST